MEHISFGSVESLHNKVKMANKRYVGERRFFVKPKLHGTNASIVAEGKGGVYAQSRKNVITPEQDNAGFASWVDGLDIDTNSIAEGVTWVVYGEWAGDGIQKNDAVTQIGKKAFFVFALRAIIGDEEYVHTDPDQLALCLQFMKLHEHPDIYVIPTMAELDINYNGNAVQLESVENTINSLVSRFEEVDPYIYDQFGVEAPGEGVVVYPKTNDWDTYKALMFKAKTKTHSVNKAKKAASAKVQVSPDVLDFADRFATEARFEQGISELGIDIDMPNMGKFLKWVNEDVIKESKDELEESELDWKKCSKEITNRARMWFMSEAKRIV